MSQETSTLTPDSYGQVYVVSYFKPLAGKKDIIIAGMKELAAAVEENEPRTQVYEVFWDEEEGVVVVMPKYADVATAEAHKNSTHLQEAMKRSTEAVVLAAPPQTKVLTKLASFVR
ncbi:hypothetical protein NA57DRAFT_56688 [Rhizodiscina lignyota]|uniref:ABM domain-containing protein n=1 Tax=Rhizodiscina lignyota TaxID=1504668 RepID=A0A9P4IDX3_9PEZI|nr:hypothetical protein NA57DRAFT_56688 [Rhizodiscina lignyota]